MNIFFKKCTDIQSTIEELSKCNSTIGDDINIYFDNVNFIDISSLAIVCNWIKKITENNNVIKLKVNDSDAQCISYVSRMDFFKIIGYNYKEEFKRHSAEGKFLPIEIFEKYDTQLITKIINILRNTFKFTKDDPVLYMLDYSVNELLENIDRHSETKNHSTIVVQSYPSKHKLDFCIIDNGIGIPNSLRKTQKYKKWTDEECILNSTKRNIRTEENNGQGNGLHIMKNFVKSTKGSFSIFSDCSVYKYDAENNIDKTHKIDGFWQGTIIKISVNTNHSVNINDILENPNYEPFSPAIDDLEDFFD